MKGLRKIKTFVHINSTYNLQENIKENGHIIHPRLKSSYTNTSKQNNLLKQQEELFYLELALSKTTKMPCFTSYAFVERVPLVVLKSFCLCDTISNFKWFFIQQENRVIIQLIYGEKSDNSRCSTVHYNICSFINETKIHSANVFNCK